MFFYLLPLGGCLIDTNRTLIVGVFSPISIFIFFLFIFLFCNIYFYIQQAILTIKENITLISYSNASKFLCQIWKTVWIQGLNVYIYVVLFATIWKESMTCKKSCDTLFCDIRKIIPALTYKWRTKSWGKINTNIIGHRCAFFDKFKSF